MSSLLEVGTGFHPELTGRDNVYLNGTILGMRKKEVDRKFDEIVSFSGVEKFIDTPVKRYSSGMKVRLAFSVAAHLEPEILVVDEVLAVGDADFQKKCLNKMHDVGQCGRTVLFVSHNMQAITRLCERVILLDEGKVLKDGPSHQVVSLYLNSSYGTMAIREWPDPDKAPCGEIARLCAVRVRNEDGVITDAIDIRRHVKVEMEYEVFRPGSILLPNFHFYNEDGLEVFVIVDLDPVWRRRKRPEGRYQSTAMIPGNLLSEGTLFVRANLCMLDPQTIQFDVPEAVAFQVIDSLDGDSARGDFAGWFPGVVRPLVEWSTRFRQNGDSANDIV
jgi:lipopolysaccharide transport system ATP-binding protein